jgi:beta-mannanase
MSPIVTPRAGRNHEVCGVSQALCGFLTAARKLTTGSETVIAVKTIASPWIAAALAVSTSVAGALAASLGTAAAPHDNRPVAHSASPVVIGAYDPHGDFSDDGNIKIEALFLPWQDVDLTTLRGADDYARHRGRSLLVTVEPWTWSKTDHVAPPALLQGILAGRYDGNIAAICSIVGKFETATTIRWAQEMEDPELRFPWRGWTGEEYKAAYRHFVDRCRRDAPRAKFMWSPKGLTGLDKYYPGDAYVDVVGLSVFGLQPYDQDKFGHDRTFVEALKPGYDLVAKYNRPICVAELGYSGDADYVHNWAEAALKPYPQFPRLQCVVYFNDKDSAPWPGRYGVPDWRVNSNVMP